MTRRSQKESESWSLNALLSVLDISPDEIHEGEQPDFMLAVSGRTVGVEVRMYQSGTTVGAGFGQRQVESEWESLRVASREFRAAQADISNVSVGLMFHDVVPARKEHQAFMQEIAAEHLEIHHLRQLPADRRPPTTPSADPRRQITPVVPP